MEFRTIKELAQLAGITQKTISNFIERMDDETRDKHVSKNEKGVTIVNKEIILKAYPPKIDKEQEKEIQHLRDKLKERDDMIKYLKNQLDKAQTTISTKESNEMLRAMERLGMTKDDLKNLSYAKDIKFDDFSEE